MELDCPRPGSIVPPSTCLAQSRIWINQQRPEAFNSVSLMNKVVFSQPKPNPIGPVCCHSFFPRETSPKLFPIYCCTRVDESQWILDIPAKRYSDTQNNRRTMLSSMHRCRWLALQGYWENNPHARWNDSMICKKNFLLLLRGGISSAEKKSK